MVTTTTEGVFLVHSPEQPPVNGMAVYRYPNGIWACELHGPQGCAHIEEAQRSAR